MLPRNKTVSSSNVMPLCLRVPNLRTPGLVVLSPSFSGLGVKHDGAPEEQEQPKCNNIMNSMMPYMSGP